MTAFTPQGSSFGRRPRRLTITVPHHAFDALLERSDHEGRSLSNLAAYLLESALQLIPSETMGAERLISRAQSTKRR